MSPVPKQQRLLPHDVQAYLKSWAETPTEEESPSTDAGALLAAIDNAIERARRLCKKHGILFASCE